MTTNPNGPEVVRELTEAHVATVRTGDYTILPMLLSHPELVERASENAKKSFFVALLGIIGDTRGLFTTGVKKESATAMRILTLLIVNHNENTQYKQLLRHVGAEEIKKLKLDRHLQSSKADVGPSALEFIRVILVVLHCTPGEVLESEQTVQRVVEILGPAVTRGRSDRDREGRRRSRTQGPPGETRARSQRDADRERRRQLPPQRKGESPPFNPLYQPGGEPCLLDVQAPDPVLFFAKHFGLGCVPKTPKWTNRMPPPSDAITLSVSGYRPSKSGAAAAALVGSQQPDGVVGGGSAAAGGPPDSRPNPTTRHADPTALSAGNSPLPEISNNTSSPQQGPEATGAGLGHSQSSPTFDRAHTTDEIPLNSSSTANAQRSESERHVTDDQLQRTRSSGEIGQQRQSAAATVGSSPLSPPPAAAPTGGTASSSTTAAGGSGSCSRAFAFPPPPEEGTPIYQLLAKYRSTEGGGGGLQGWGTCRMGELGPTPKLPPSSRQEEGGNSPSLQSARVTPRSASSLLSSSSQKVTQVRAGSQYTLILTGNGQVFCCGAGEWGQLGLGDPAENLNEFVDGEIPVKTTPAQIKGFKSTDKIANLSAGFAFAIATSQKGEIYLWGNNNHGQCSVGSKPTKNTLRIPSPVKVAMKGSRIIDAVCGSFFVVALTDNHVVLSWGLVSLLGLGPENEVLQHIDQQWVTTSLSKEKRNVAIHPCKVSALDSRKVVKLAAGQWHVIAIGLEGGVYSWGIGHQGRLGHNGTTSESRPKRIQAMREYKCVDAACGSFHTAIVTKDGAVFCCGDNASGQCGIIGTPSFLVPTRVPGFGIEKSVASDSDERRTFMEMSRSGSISNHFAVAVTCGREHTCVLTSEGDVFVFGSGVGLGSGLGVRNRVPHPRKIMSSFVHLSVSCGVGHGFSQTLPRRTELIPAGTLHVGDCRNSAINLSDGLVAAALGASFTVLLNCSGDVYTFGNGDWGQLGLGPMQNVPDRKASGGCPYMQHPSKVTGLGKTVKISSIAAGYAFVYAISETHQVFFWGNNNHCQGGLGVDSKSLLKVDDPMEVKALSQLDVVAVACGSFFVIALTTSGDVYGWGLQDCCGIVDLSAEDSVHLTSSATAEKRSVIASPIKIPELSNVIQIATGQWHSVALTEAGVLYSWGVGHQGRLGHGNTNTLSKPTRIQFDIPFTTIDCGSFNSCAISSCGDLYVWGDNESGQCGLQGMNLLLVPTLAASGVAKASCGRQHTVIVTRNGEVMMTGMIQHGGNPISSETFQFPAGLFGSNIVSQEQFRKKYHANDVFSGPHHILLLVERERPPAHVVHGAQKEIVLLPRRLAAGEAGGGVPQTSPLGADANRLASNISPTSQPTSGSASPRVHSGGSQQQQGAQFPSVAEGQSLATTYSSGSAGRTRARTTASARTPGQ